MRVFHFQVPGFKRYIDLDHVQQITELDFASHSEGLKHDADGIASRSLSHGHARFSYQMAFQSEWSVFEMVHRQDRYEYDTVRNGERSTNKYDATIPLEAARQEYERFLAEWNMGQNKLEVWQPST